MCGDGAKGRDWRPGMGASLVFYRHNFLIFYVISSRYTNRTSGGQTTVYAILLKWPTGNNLTLGSPFPSTHTTVVSMLGYDGPNFSWRPSGSQGMVIALPPIAENKLPCKWAWVFKLEGLLQKPRNPAHPVYFPEFDHNKPPHKHYRPVVNMNMN